MTHFFTIALDHRLQFIDILRCDLSPDKAIQAINNRQHPDNKIDTDIHNPTIVTQLNGEQYKESKWSVSIDLIFQLSVRSWPKASAQESGSNGGFGQQAGKFMRPQNVCFANADNIILMINFRSTHRGHLAGLGESPLLTRSCLRI